MGGRLGESWQERLISKVEGEGGGRGGVVGVEEETGGV